MRAGSRKFLRVSSCALVTPWRKFADVSNNAELLSVAQAAKSLGKSPRTILRWIDAGTLPAQKLGSGTAAYVLDRAEIERVRLERTEVAS